MSVTNQSAKVVGKPLHLDIETFSECDLKDAGAYRYAEHPSTEVLCFAYAFGDEEVKQWLPGQPVPAEIIAHIEAGGDFRAHNAQFERTVLNGVAGQKIGFPRISIEQTTCTAVKAAAAGIPRSLGEGSKALGTAPKSEAGRIEMLQLCKPKKATKKDPSTRYTPENAPEKFALVYAYNIDDVKAERELDHALPDLIASEQEMYHIDQRINDRGIAVDLKAVADIMYVIEDYKAKLAVECEEITRDWLTGEGLKPTQREKIAEWIRANGYPSLADMTADTVKEIIKGDSCPQIVKRLLKIYSTYNAKAISKYQAIVDAVCADGRLRGMFLFLGAGTGRWSSLIVQLQNLFRPVITDPENAIEAFAMRDLEWIRTLYPDVDPVKVAASCVRSVLVAGSGKDLLFLDFVGIESRVNPWFFGEEWKLDAFRAQDQGTGPDSYKVAFCNAFNVSIDSIDWKSTAGKNCRQIGKCMELFFNYEGGVGAFLTAVETYGIDLEEMTKAVLPTLTPEALDHAAWMHKHHPATGVTEDQETACNGLKFLWRRAHPKIKQGWKDLKEAAEMAVQFPGKAFVIPGGKIAFKQVAFNGRNWLKMRLPSGRCISYYNPSWIPAKESERYINGVLEPYTIPGELRYWGLDTRTRQWVLKSTYGGALDENADQGFSADLLRNGLRQWEAAGLCVVGSVHDEALAEIDERAPPDTFERARGLMLTQPSYADGLPLAAEGFRQRRYRK